MPDIPTRNQAPPRRTGTISLWSHLLQKSKTPSQGPTPTEQFLPPAAPNDKSGTSMRMLLHDTQANFEKFSVHVNKLLASSEEARKDLVVVKSQFEREHESLANEIADLVNRNQLEVKKSLNEGRQATSELQLLVRELSARHVASDKAVDALRMTSASHATTLASQFSNVDHRFDALQTLIHGQAQTIQHQATLLQTLQEQFASLTPLVATLGPLLQALPIQIDSSRAAIHSDVLRAIENSNNHIHLLKESINEQAVTRAKRLLSPSSRDAETQKRRKLNTPLAPRRTERSHLVTPRPSSDEKVGSKSTKGISCESRRPFASLRAKHPSHITFRFNPRGVPSQLASGIGHQNSARVLSSNVNHLPNPPVQQNVEISGNISSTVMQQPAHSHGLPSSSPAYSIAATVSPPPPIVNSRNQRLTLDSATVPLFQTPQRQGPVVPEKPMALFSALQGPAPALAQTVQRGRRSPFKEGKRFIPLVDSDDE